jgi:hypothetical protein
LAIIKTNRYPVTNHVILEDVTPGTNDLFFQLDAYDKNTLVPVYDKAVNHNTTGLGISTFGQFQSDSGGAGRLFLNGNVIENSILPAVNTAFANIDPIMMMSMDPQRPVRKIRFDSNATDSMLGIFSAYRNTPQVDHCVRRNLIDIKTTLPFANTSTSTNSYYPVYFNASTGNLIVLAFNNASIFPSTRIGRLTSYIQGTFAIAWQAEVANETGQFIGVDNAGYAIWLRNSTGSDISQIISRFNDQSNATTVLSTNTVAPAAGGTSAGGNRGANFGNFTAKYSSETFEFPVGTGIRCWYTPYLDVNGRIHPFLFSWNRNDDTFVRNSNITVDWGTLDGAPANQDNYWVPFVGVTAVSRADGLQKIWYNQTWTVNTGSEVKRYLMFMQLHGTGTVMDDVPRMRTFVVFLVDPSDPTRLSFHSSITIPATPMSFIWLNEEKTIMGVLTPSNFYTYSFNDGNGWVQTGAVPFAFYAVGQDSFGRIWALTRGQTGFGEIHLISLNVPVSISVVSSQSTFNFVGTPINSTIIVNAYSPSGSRIAVNVKLVIDGGSMTFTGANLTTTITTSVDSDTSVPVIITGPGIANIVSSVVF